MHEDSLHSQSYFLTLTYNEENLPKDEGLHHHHFQDFMKRYRYALSPKKISYYMCGEYGEQFGRPHYHALIFGHRPNDCTETENQNYYRSESIEKHWQKGFITIGNITPQSAAYVARYIMKKINGDQANDHYFKCDPHTGEALKVKPEYNTMSKNPAIGKGWFDKFGQDIEKNSIHLDGKPYPIPQYYLKLLKKSKPELYLKLIAERTELAKDYNPSDYTLKVRENRLKNETTKRPLK